MKKFLFTSTIFAISFLVFIGCQFLKETETNNQKTYFNNGKLHTITPFEDGKAHGIKLEYYESGNIRKEVPYVKGVVNGTVKTYYTNGEIYSETPRVKGKIDGTVRKYHENGILLSETYYANNELQPGLKEYDNKGNLRDEYKMKFAQQVNKRSADKIAVLNVELAPSVKKVDFFQQVSSDETGRVFIPIHSNENIGQVSSILTKGSSIDYSIVIKAEFITRYHNRGVIIDSTRFRARNN